MTTTTIPPNLKGSAIIEALNETCKQSLEGILNQSIQSAADNSLESLKHQSAVSFNGQLDGKVIIAFSANAMQSFKKAILGDANDAEEERFTEIHLTWEVANIVGGNVCAELERHGTDVTLSAIKTITKMSPENIAQNFYFKKFKLQGESIQVAILL